MEQHPQSRQGTSQERSHVPFRERCKMCRGMHQCCSSSQYIWSKDTTGLKKKSDLAIFPEVLKGDITAASHPSDFQAVPPHGRGSAGHGTHGRKHLARAQLGRAGFSPPCPGSWKWFLARFLWNKTRNSPYGAWDTNTKSSGRGGPARVALSPGLLPFPASPRWPSPPLWFRGCEGRAGAAAGRRWGAVRLESGEERLRSSRPTAAVAAGERRQRASGAPRGRALRWAGSGGLR